MSNPKVTIETSKGDIVIELYPDEAPQSVENFLQYVDNGFYENTLFHRVIPGFMIQGGGFDTSMQRKATLAPIQNEADNGLSNDRGTIAMARTNDPHSATSQFFINSVDNTFLNHSGKNPQGWGYAVFGAVAEGMEVVVAISAVRTGIDRQTMMRDVPEEPVVIRKAYRHVDI